MESAGRRNCKAHPLQGLRESSRRTRLTHKAKVKKLDPAACPMQNTCAYYPASLNVLVPHSKRYEPDVRDI